MREAAARLRLGQSFDTPSPPACSLASCHCSFLRDVDLVEKKLLDELKMNRLNPALSKIVKVGEKAEPSEGDKEDESAPAAAV